MSYTRVIPRDLFNEAKLKKCMGQLSLKILDYKVPEGLKIEIEESGEPFEIWQDDSDGSISIKNYPVTVNDRRPRFYTPLNSKAPYPLMCFIDDEYYKVFNDTGEFTDEFINLKNILQPKKYTLEELENMPTIHQGHFDDVKIDNGRWRVCLSRCTKADGMPYDNQVTVEQYLNNKWEIIDQYEAK